MLLAQAAEDLQDEPSPEGPTLLMVSGMEEMDGCSSTQRKQWTQYEDETVRRLVHLHGTRSWTMVAQHLPGRTGKQCRERWHNHLDHDIRKDAWSVEEDRMLFELHEKFGNKWADIAKYLQGRTDNAVKNHWNSALRRGKNIDHLLVDGKIPSAFPDGIPPIPGGLLGTPTSIEAAKINNLLRTNPQSSLAQLIDFPVVEGAAPRSEHAQGGLDALLAMLRAKTAADLLEATSRLQSAIGSAPLGSGDNDYNAVCSESFGETSEAQTRAKLESESMQRHETSSSAALAAALVETSGSVADDLTPSALGVQVADLLTPNTSADLGLIGACNPAPAVCWAQEGNRPTKHQKINSSLAVLPPVQLAMMAPPPAPAAADRQSRLRSKRPAGATDLHLHRPEHMGLQNSGLSSGGIPSGTSLAGYLESPAMLNQFAAQMSPKVGEQFGLTPNAMLDFLTTDDMLAQISS